MKAIPITVCATGLLLALFAAACQQMPQMQRTETQRPETAMPADEGAGDEWRTIGGDAGRTYFSRLTDVDTGNASRLGLAWEFLTRTHRVLEATPIVIDGVMYVSGPLGRVWALDAASGALRWSFEPEVDMQVNRSACCDWANRGVAVRDGRVFVAALDGWLYALDAGTGAMLWKADTIVDRGRGYTSTGAPEVTRDLVLIGNAGGEYDTRGYVTAYEMKTGREAWRFWIVPRDPRLGPQEAPYLEAALKTWSRESRWDIGGGGNAWDAIVYDAVTDTVFVGTGNGGPHSAADRSPGGGDNLYLSSIVALDPKTGVPRWHYQQVPGDQWDFTATQPLVLTNLTIDGLRRPVLLHAPKNGFLYVLDRRDGKLLRAHKIVKVNWTTGIDLATGRPAPNPAADYTRGRPSSFRRARRAQLAPDGLEPANRTAVRVGAGDGKPDVSPDRRQSAALRAPPQCRLGAGRHRRFAAGVAAFAAPSAGSREGVA
jgi:quinohemoprotein ethanol dehydrogenase